MSPSASTHSRHSGQVSLAPRAHFIVRSHAMEQEFPGPKAEFPVARRTYIAGGHR
jgi:hypothetical protein